MRKVHNDYSNHQKKTRSSLFGSSHHISVLRVLKKCLSKAVISGSSLQSLQMVSLAAETTEDSSSILAQTWPQKRYQSTKFSWGASPQIPQARSHLCIRSSTITMAWLYHSKIHVASSDPNQPRS